MPNDFDALIGELEEAGLDESYIDRLRSVTAASPIRKERDAYKADAIAALDRAQRAEAKALAASFRDMGITMKPSALRLPDDLDVTDDDKLRAWATDAGLIAAVQSVDQSMSNEERQAHANVAAASAGATTPPAANSKESLLARLDPAKGLTEEQFWAEARSAGITQD